MNQPIDPLLQKTLWGPLWRHMHEAHGLILVDDECNQISQACDESRMAAGTRKTCSRCIVHGCDNHRHQGKFVGDMCARCHEHITTGSVGPTTSFLGKLNGLMETLKTISVADFKTAGELRKMARDGVNNTKFES